MYTIESLRIIPTPRGSAVPLARRKKKGTGLRNFP